VSDHVTESARILVVSNERSTLSQLWVLGDAHGWQLETAGNGWEALERVQSGTSPDAILLDLPQGDSDGLHTLRWLRRIRPDLPVVVLSHRDDDGNKQTEAARLGAKEYLVRPLEEEQLERAIRGCLSCDSMEPDNLAESIEQIAEDMFFVAAAPSMRKLRAQAELLAQVNSPLLIVGESGSGKELAARLIHKLSVRSGFRFLKLNCAALPGDVLESELFGYDRVGGNGQRPSKLGLCQQGTLYLEEITEMPMSLQAKLLHAFQEGHLVRGENQNRPGIDVRVMAGTSLGIEQAIAEKKLREDLYYRLSAFTIHVPPLRQRKEDIPLLLGHFVNQLARRYSLPVPTIAPRILEACQRYDWPANLRELQDFVKRQLVNGGEGPMPDMLEADSELSSGKARLSPVTQDRGAHVLEMHAGEKASGLKSLLQSVKDEAEKNAIATALEQTRWNRKAAARLLKVSYRTLLYKIQQYHMSPPTYISSLVINPAVKSSGHVG
jgi:two-component system, NtrC family, response regulator AtoC